MEGGHRRGFSFARVFTLLADPWVPGHQGRPVCLQKFFLQQVSRILKQRW